MLGASVVHADEAAEVAVEEVEEVMDHGDAPAIPKGVKEAIPEEVRHDATTL